MGLGANIVVNGVNADDLMASGVVQSIDIYERIGETTYYSIQFGCDIQDDDLTLLADARLNPGGELAIVVSSGEALECLVKGPVYSQEINLRNGGDGSSVVVKGADSTLSMDREFKSQTFDGSDSNAVLTILSSYGMVPDVGSTSAMHVEDKHNLVQRSTDLQFVQKLARRNGYKFWVTADGLGVETAHFQRPILDGEGVADLIINRQDFNVNELSISWDAHRPSNAQGLQLDLANKSNIMGTVATAPHTLLGSTSQQAFAPQAVTIDLSAAVDDSGDLTARLEAAMMESNFFVQASCQTSVHQLRKVLRTCTLVNVIGAGSQHSGKYLVGAVHHHIDETAHVMNVELMRNAVGPSA